MVTGVLLVLSGFYMIFSQRHIGNSSKEIARAELLSGRASLLRNHQREPMYKLNPIFHLDAVETAETANVLVTLDSGDRFRIFENAHVVFDSQNDSISVLIKRGEVVVEHLTDSSPLYLIQNGQKISGLEFQVDGFASQESHSLQILKPTTAENSESTPTAELENFIAKNKGQLFKCYSSLLQRKPQVKGEVQITMTVLKSGKIHQPEILIDFSQDDTFKNCLLQVISRTEIPAYKGDSITTVIPLVFE